MTTTQAPPTALHKTILICLESKQFAQSLQKALEANGMRGTIVTGEKEALEEAKTAAPSLIILDRRRGTTSNLQRLRSLSTAPIVVVDDSGACSEEDCLQEYERDIDLVLCSQSARELVARARAILRRRRSAPEAGSQYRVGAIRMDLDRHEVTVNGRAVELTPKEFQILRQFIESPGRVFSRQEMLNRVWGEGYALEEHALDVHIHSLRHKIETDPASPGMIVTVRGIGYKLRG
jgi:DNA-binding response OmpR family regulator